MPVHDDNLLGGISGATTERPALKRLLADIEAGKIDTVVVYKVDRLTRSLSDFVKVVEIFDRKGVSFVSITQQFNTTTSMGRLTLNMLLSFAQFEREVTGERIRDKIAASKKKGMWMGGVPALGYDAKGRALVVSKAEAETVRHIYRRYVALGSVRLLKEELDQDGIVSKMRTDRYGRLTGGKPLDRGALYLILQNRIYRGEIVHKDKSYPGQHAAIIGEALWDKVHGVLATNRIDRKSGAHAKEPSLLTGLLFDDTGERMTPSHATKKGTRYRYYISRPLTVGVRKSAPDAFRVPAGDIEQLVAQRLLSLLSDKTEMHAALERDVTEARDLADLIARAEDLARNWTDFAAAQKRRLLSVLVDRIIVNRETLELGIRPARLPGLLRSTNDWRRLDDRPTGHDESVLTLTVPARLRRAGLETRLLIEGAGGGTRGEPDRSLLRLIALAYRYNQAFTGGGRSISEMANEAGVARSYFTRILRLSFLAPEITRAILQGRQPRGLTAIKLTADTRIPIAWEAQRTTLHFDEAFKR